MSKTKATVTLTGNGRSVTIDADKLPQVMAKLSEPDQPAQQSFGFDTTHDFLGDEFLTWVWWKCDTGESEFVRIGSNYGVAFEDLLQFAPCQDQDHVQTLRGGTPTRAAEARTALRRGHLLRKARLLIACEDREWSVVLDGARMFFGSVRSPDDPEDCEDADGRNQSRAANWLELFGLVEHLFRCFMVRRTDPNWIRDDAVQMAKWMAGDAT